MSSIKSFVIQSYYFLRFPKARQLRRKGIRFDHYRELDKAWLVASGIKTILDVGANEGQFAKLAREVFPSAMIYSFEPLPDCFDKLNKIFPGDPHFAAFNEAVGSTESVLEFFRSVHSPSSSFLKMENSHKEAFPYTKDGQVDQPIEVKVNSLDNFFKSHDLEKNILLKIDVQGFEGEVIKGASLALEHVKVVILELSMIKLYQDQPLFHDIYTMMYNKGFRFHGCLAQMWNPKTEEVVQVDAIFVNSNKF
jgi:FkbM family methyltransferase